MKVQKWTARDGGSFQMVDDSAIEVQTYNFSGADSIGVPRTVVEVAIRGHSALVRFSEPEVIAIVTAWHRAGSAAAMTMIGAVER